MLLRDESEGQTKSKSISACSIFHVFSIRPQSVKVKKRTSMEKMTKNMQDSSPYWIDPNLPRIVPYLRQKEDGQDSNKTCGDDFSCVLITMWPQPLDAQVENHQAAQRTLREAYGRFVSEVAKCFEPDDLVAESHAQLPRVYIYSPECLHITVATLHRFDVPTTPKERGLMQKIYTDLFQRAAKRPNWPPKGGKMRFAVDSTRIGEKAGILLWKETTGNLQKIRDCVAEEHAASYDDIVQAVGAESANSFQIPNIVHSTFMRFAGVPKTDWDEMQTKFADVQRKVTGELFGDLVVETDVVRLACERRPYMHIPCDEEHVFKTVKL